MEARFYLITTKVSFGWNFTKRMELTGTLLWMGMYPQRQKERAAIQMANLSIPNCLHLITVNPSRLFSSGTFVAKGKIQAIWLCACPLECSIGSQWWVMVTSASDTHLTGMGETNQSISRYGSRVKLSWTCHSQLHAFEQASYFHRVLMSLPNYAVTELCLSRGDEGSVHRCTVTLRRSGDAADRG